MHLTDQQNQEMEKRFVVRMLAEACREYSLAAQELDERDGFRRYVMHRAGSAGMTIEEIAAASELTASDVAALLDDDDARVDDDPTHDEAQVGAPDGTWDEVQDGTQDDEELANLADSIKHLKLDMSDGDGEPAGVWLEPTLEDGAEPAIEQPGSSWMRSAS